MGSDFRTQVIGKALELISEERFRNAFEEIAGILPEYFWRIPAAKNGSHHASYSKGEGGLARHCLATLLIGNELMRDSVICPEEVQENLDLTRLALFLHDGCKRGWPNELPGTEFEHPLTMCRFLRENFSAGKITSLSENEIDFLCSLISTHMGPWIQHWETGEEILQPPKSNAQKFVHLCDYIASRKNVEFVLF